MNADLNRGITFLAVFVIGVVLVLSIVVSALGSGANSLGVMVKYFGVVAFMIGFTAPRLAIIALIVVSGYLDLLKRLLILGGSLSFLDVIYVLAIAPLLVAGMTANFLMQLLLGKMTLQKTDYWICFVIGTIAVFALLGAQREGAGILGLLQAAANNVSYAFLLLLIPKLFSDTKAIYGLINICVLAFIPVAIYGIVQAVFGFSDLEMAYLNSGYTMEIRQLYDNVIRPFSTLNSAHALGATSCILMVLSLLPFRIPNSSLFYGKFVGAVLALLYMSSLLVSLNRTAWVTMICAIILSILFSRRSTTIAAYVIGGLFFLVVVLFSDTIWRNVVTGKWQGVRSSNQYIDMAGRLATFNERLVGFTNLKRKENYTWFGIPRYRRDIGEKIGMNSKGETGYGTQYSHDKFTGFLLSFGVVGSGIALLIIGTVLVKFHKVTLRLPPGGLRGFLMAIQGLAFSVLFVGGAAGGHLQVFPVNALFYLLIGLALLAYQIESRRLSKLTSHLNEAQNSTGLAF